MKSACVFLASIALLTAQAYAEANVIQAEQGCTIGWIGCPLSAAIPLPDGSYDCPLSAISLVPITGDRTSVEANNAGGRVIWHCRTQIAFGQLNPIGVNGSLGQIVAARPEIVCLLFPLACRGNGAVIANETTVGGAARCAVNGIITTDLQSQITPSGQASLMCFLPTVTAAGGVNVNSIGIQTEPQDKPVNWGNVKKLYD